MALLTNSTADHVTAVTLQQTEYGTVNADMPILAFLERIDDTVLFE